MGAIIFGDGIGVGATGGNNEKEKQQIITAKDNIKIKRTNNI